MIDDNDFIDKDMHKHKIRHCEIEQIQIEKLQREKSEYQQLAAQLYQIVGTISFEFPENKTLVKVLDNLSDVQKGKSPRHKELLPFSLTNES